MGLSCMGYSLNSIHFKWGLLTHLSFKNIRFLEATTYFSILDFFILDFALFPRCILALAIGITLLEIVLCTVFNLWLTMPWILMSDVLDLTLLLLFMLLFVQFFEEALLVMSCLLLYMVVLLFACFGFDLILVWVESIIL